MANQRKNSRTSRSKVAANSGIFFLVKIPNGTLDAEHFREREELGKYPRQ